jgi:AcrR family transcriptional regulator
MSRGAAGRGAVGRGAVGRGAVGRGAVGRGAASRAGSGPAAAAQPPPPPRGRPRSEKGRRAILQAASELLLERGLGAVSVDAVAERAGVSKATIYRWWPNKETLALEALYEEWKLDHTGETGTLRGDLLALLSPWVRVASARPYGRVVAALLAAAGDDPSFAQQYLARFVQPRRDHARRILKRARERGELAPGVELEVALDLIYGPIYHRLLHGHAPLSQRFAVRVIDTVLAGIGPRGG